MATFPADSVRTKNWSSEVLTDADQEAQLDLLHNYFKACLDSATGHDHSGTANQSKKISPANLLIASQAAGDILYASSASAWARLAKGTASQVLAMKSDATIPEWKTLDIQPDGSVVQVVNVQTGAVATGTATIPDDDTIPQITEGTEFMTLSITPKSATNKLKIDVVGNFTVESLGENVTALFQDATSNALAASYNMTPTSTNYKSGVAFTHYMTAGTTSATTFRVRAGSSSGNVTFNGAGGNRKLGGVLASSITITEIKAS